MSSYKDTHKRYYKKNRDRLVVEMRTRRRRDHERAREQERRLRNVYNITIDEFNAMIARQNSCCEICGRAMNTRKEICVDHNHDTGAVRGLLCHSCNIGIAKFSERQEVLLSAVKYLDKYNTTKEVCDE